MGWIRFVRWEKSRRDFAPRAFALITLIHPILHRVSCSYETIWNAPKYYAMHQNMSLRSNVADWLRSLRKIPAWLRGTSFRIKCTNSPCLHRVSCVYEMIPNAPKHYATHQNMSLGSNGGIGCIRCKKIPTWLRGTNFCINCSSSPCFASSLMRLRNDPKCTQTLCNAPKHEFRVQWSGLGAFIAKNPDVTLWHVLLH